MKYLYILLLLIAPLSQHYALQQNTPVLFCIPDELGWTRGCVVYLWGYYPIIYSEIGIYEFKNTVWDVAYE